MSSHSLQMPWRLLLAFLTLFVIGTPTFLPTPCAAEEVVEDDPMKDLRTIPFERIRALDNLVPRTTQFYTIAPGVGIDLPFYVFKVEAPHATYHAKSIMELMKLVHEITVLEEYKSSEQGSQVWKGVTDGFKGVGQGAKHLVLHPGQSIKGIGRMAARLGRGIGRLVKKPFQKKDPAATDTGRVGNAGGFLFPKQARTFAYNHTLDVYSDNPWVRQLIYEVSKKRWVGGMAAKLTVKLVSPIAYLGMVTKGSLTPGARDEVVEQLIRDNGGAELRRLLLVQYMEALNLDKKADAKQLEIYTKHLNNPNFTPRETAYIWLYVTRMKDLAGHDAMLRLISEVKTVEDAKMLARQLELLYAVHQYGTPLSAYVVMGHRIGCLTTQSDLLLLAPYDLLDEDTLGRQLRNELRTAQRSSRARTANLWLLGAVTRAFADKARAEGISVRTNILQDKVFRAQKSEAGTPSL